MTTSRNIYDRTGRLTAGTRYAGTATTGTASFTERGISYDKAGGMLALQRYGQNASTAEDNILLTYNGMRLSAVTGIIGGQSINASFTYDDCGRTTYDGVSSLNYVYDPIGALASVSDASTSATLSTYRHLADGTKYATVSPSGGALIYRGPFTLKVADISASIPSVSFLRAETGSAGAAIIANTSGTGAAPYYYVADHIGSVRAIVDGQGNIVERNDYYAYGKRHTTGRTYATLANSQLLFSGKEDQGQALDLASGATIGTSDLRILDFGARHYDPIVPRWTTQDPLAEKYFPINPYAYCAGDPVNRIDLIGLEFTERSNEHINRVVSYANQQILGLSLAKEMLSSMSKSGLLNLGNTKLFNDVMSGIDRSINEFKSTINEISELSKSNQLYDIYIDAKSNSEGEYISEIYFEHKDKTVKMAIADNMVFSIAHELKHAYQFENGLINFTKLKYSFIDKTDEREAYTRGEYFGGPHYDKLPRLYDRLVEEPLDFNCLGSIVNNPNDLKRYIAGSAIEYAIRINGVTYSTPGRLK